MAPARDQAYLSLTQSLLNDSNLSYLKELVTPDNPQVDLVAVHGLRIPTNFIPWKDPQSFGVRTWVAGDAGQETLWLKDFLPYDIQGLRVLLFGYNSNVGWDTSTAGVSGAADDLLLKLKNKRVAIAKARSNPKYVQLFNSVRGIAFFATPHRGGLAAKHGAAVAGAFRHVTRNPRSSIMEALRADSLISSDIHQYFLDSLTKIRVCSFYEMKPLPGIGRLVVDKNSALLGLQYPQEDAIPVPESNHSTVCKFDSRTQNYELVVSGITDLVDWAQKKGSASEKFLTIPETSPASFFPEDDTSFGLSASFHDLQVSHSYLPDSSDVDLSISEEARSQTLSSEPFYLWPSIAFEQFIGRKALIDSILEALMLKRSHQSRLALYGLGGVGKTQIALQLIQWYRSSCPNESIYWIHGGSTDVLRQSLTEVAIRRKLLAREDRATDPLDAARRFLLNEDNGKWLMVVDNADDPDTFFEPSTVSPGTSRDPNTSHKVALSTFVPRCAHGRIVFTTNNKALGERLSMHGLVIEIPHLDLPEACELLQERMFEDKRLEKSPPSYQREIPAKTDLERLCEYLDCLPLALTQAAAFMRQQNVTVGQYTKLLDDDESRLSHLLAHNFQASDPDNDFSKAIESTWNISFDRIQAHSPAAADLLSFMAFLDSKNIPKFLLRYVVGNDWDLTVTGLGPLHSYAIVNLASKNETFSIHRLVQHAMRKRLASVNAAAKWSRKVLSILSEHFPNGDHESWQTCATLTPHASQVLKNEFSNHAEDMLLVATLQFKISQYYRKVGLYSQAVELTSEALETLIQLTDAPNDLVYRTKSLRAEVLKENSQLQEAEDLAKEVWYERQNELGAKHIDTLRSYDALAMMYQEQGKYKEGIKAARFILKSLRKTLKEDDIILQLAKRRLGRNLHKVGEFSEAEALLREALDVCKAQLSPDDNVTLKIKWSLAWILRDEGKYIEAEQMSFETWTAQGRTIGEDHPECLKSLFLYADILQAQSKFEAALTFQRHVYARAIALIGPKHRYTLIVAASLASCLVASSQANGSFTTYEEASQLYRAVLEGRDKSLPTDHPETLSARTDVATMLRLDGSLKEAETFERQTLEKAKARQEKQHPIVLASRENLARILWAQKDSPVMRKEAAKHIKKVLSVKEKRYGWSYRGTRDTASLVVEMIADGKEKEQLKQKIAKSSTEASLDDTSRSSFSIDKESKSASGSMSSARASHRSLDKPSVGKTPDDACFNG